MNRDTTPEAEEVLFRLWRETPGWRELALLEDLNRTARLMAVSGLRHRYPDADDNEIRRRLADLLLGPELAPAACGPLRESGHD